MNGAIKSTEMGTLILYPPEGEEQKRKLLINAFKTPLLYQKIIERYENMILPNNVILKNVFLHLGIAPKALDSAVDSFITSAQYANVLDSNNRLTISDIDKGTLQLSSIESESLKQKSSSQQIIEGSNETQKETQKIDLDFHKLEFITSNGKKAYIQIPIGCEKNDLERIKKILDNMCGD
jgi:hypothetical protein